MDPKHHWEAIYRNREPTSVSWYEESPDLSLRFIEAAGLPFDAPILDLGGGTSVLAGRLLDLGFTDVSVLDLAPSALEAARKRLGSAAERIRWIEADVTTWTPPHCYALWHDRAVFHFLTTTPMREAYVSALRGAVSPGGQAVLATFGPSGPLTCSGLDVVRYSPQSLALTLGPAFTLIESADALHRTPVGVEQVFIYCRFRALPSP